MKTVLSTLTLAALAAGISIPSVHADEPEYLTGLKLFPLPVKKKVVKTAAHPITITEVERRYVSPEEKAKFQANIRRGLLKPPKTITVKDAVPQDTVEPMRFDWDDPRAALKQR